MGPRGRGTLLLSDDLPGDQHPPHPAECRPLTRIPCCVDNSHLPILADPAQPGRIADLRGPGSQEQNRDRRCPGRQTVASASAWSRSGSTTDGALTRWSTSPPVTVGQAHRRVASSPHRDGNTNLADWARRWFPFPDAWPSGPPCTTCYPIARSPWLRAASPNAGRWRSLR
jgi:hypothetical protein